MNRLDRLKEQHPDLNVSLIDIFSFLNSIFSPFLIIINPFCQIPYAIQYDTCLLVQAWLLCILLPTLQVLQEKEIKIFAMF